MNTRLMGMGLLGVLLLLAAGCGPDHPGRRSTPRNTETFYVIGSGLTVEERSRLGQALQDQIAEKARYGDVLTIIAAPQHAHVATFVVPEGSRNTRLRHKAIRQQLPALMKFLETISDSGEGQVQLPSLAATVRSLRRTVYPCRIVVVGSPRYVDPRQPAWAMHEPYIPTDASIGAAQTPFTTETTFPADTLVHWLTQKQAEASDPLHREATHRFNRLFVQELGGTLLAITPDVEIAFNFSTPTEAERLQKEPGSPGMRRVTVQFAQPTPPAEAAPVEVPLFEPVRPVTPSLPAPPVAQAPEPPVQARPADAAQSVLDIAQANKDTTAIAITWQCVDSQCDIDLHIRSKGHAEEMNFSQKITAFGELYRDVQTGGPVAHSSSDFTGWEWARIDHPRTGDLTVMLHTYRASAPVQVQVIWVAGGVRKEQRFQLPALRGSNQDPAAWKQLSF